jgi:tetratricopeptide (TPR) repeat protein
LEPEVFEDVCETLSRRHCILRPARPEKLQDGTVSVCYEFVHVLYRKVCYRRIVPGRRSKLHMRIGEWVEAHWGRLNESATWLADHFEQGGDWPRAVKYLQLAAETAVRRFEPRHGAQILEHALELVSKLPEAERAPNEIKILETLGSLYGVSYDSRAVETYERLAAHAGSSGLIDVEVTALINMGELLLWTNPRRGLETLDRALQYSASQVDAIARARSRMKCAYLRIWAGTWNDEDASVCRDALSELRQLGDRVSLAPHLIDSSNLLYMSSEYRKSRSLALEGLATLISGLENNPCATLQEAIGAYIVYSDSLFLGEWGEALREMESALAALIRNGNDGFARAMQLWQAWLKVFAMDFAGGLALCESVARSFGDATPTSNRRFHAALAAAAEVGLEMYQPALKRLLLARREMNQEMVTNDWLCRMLLESTLAELYLCMDDLVQAHVQGDRFLEASLATKERTWQTLAWEVNARVAIAERDLTRAQDCIAKALSTMEGFELPLAAWRAHATAFELYQSSGDRDLAERHLALSRETIMQLANSLPAEEALRQIFLSAPMITRILSDGIRNPRLRA